MQKQTVWVLVQYVKSDNDEERKRVIEVCVYKQKAQKRMNELVIEFANKKDIEGKILWNCERPWWNIANFKSTARHLTFRIEVVEREIGI